LYQEATTFVEKSADRFGNPQVGKENVDEFDLAVLNLDPEAAATATSGAGWPPL
jgi:hypothetical protein